MLGRINARNRFRNAGNMNRRFMPNMFGRMGGGIGSMFPRFRPPTIEEAKGRNMANVSLLPDYMQPGGSGIPPMEVGAPVDPATDRFNKAADQLRSSAIVPRFPVMNRPRPPIGMAPFQQGRMAMGFEEGGEAKKYPNAGLAALAKEAPEVVERMGYAGGGSADAARALTRATFVTAPISSSLGLARGLVMSPAGGLVSLGLAGKSLSDYYNTLENPPMVTTTYTQDEMDALRRPAMGVAKGSPLAELGSGRTISEQDRQIVSDYFGIEGGALSDRDISLLIKKMAKDILGESGRTISNRDRQIIREVVPSEMD